MSSPVLRSLRPAILLVAMILMGQAVVSVTTAPTSAATVHTRVASCAGQNFHPINSDTDYSTSGRMVVRRSNQGDGWFLCDPHLPHKAVVTRVRFTVRDVFEYLSVEACALRRASLAASDESSQTLAQIAATGLAARPGNVRRSDTSISRATIDNTAYSYWLQCHITFDGNVELNAPLGGIMGADVTYRISSTNG